MDFFLSIDGVKKGPFSLFKVRELLDSGQVTPETLAWHRDLDGWKPIREIPALEDFRDHPGKETAPPADRPVPPPLPRTVPPAATSGDLANRPRPMVRFWARMFDYTAVSVAVFLLSDISIPQPQPGEAFSDAFSRYLESLQKPEAMVFARTLFLALIGWHFVEAVLVHLTGSTPGKALFGIRLQRAGGGKIPFLRSIGRSFYVYVLGVGFYQFPFIVVGMVFSFFRLTTTGLCLWDQHLETRVEVPLLSPLRIMLAIAAFFALFLFQSLKIS